MLKLFSVFLFYFFEQFLSVYLKEREDWGREFEREKERETHTQVVGLKVKDGCANPLQFCGF
jgi:hypothetical protein